jgi:rod shape-determining protein MreC
MLKRPHIIALGLVVLIALVVLSLPHNAASHLKLAIGSLFLPLFGVSKSAHQVAGKAGDSLVSRAELLRQNEDLRRTNAVLQLATAQTDAVLRENERLRQLFDWQRQSPWKDRLKLASVIAIDPTISWQTVWIDLGTRNGVRTDLPVLNPAGFLVGRISSVSLTRSQVLLLGDPNCKVSASVEKTGANGIIIGGASPLEGSLVTLNLPFGAGNLKPGMVVFTSGMGLLPKGITIGQIAEEPRTTELGSAEVRVKLGANPGALEEVWVLLP